MSGSALNVLRNRLEASSISLQAISLQAMVSSVHSTTDFYGVVEGQWITQKRTFIYLCYMNDGNE